jgi:hypothetical protein
VLAGELLATGPAQARPAHVHEDRGEPRAGGGRVAQLPDSPQRDHERVLHRVLGVGTVAEHPDGEPVQPRTVAGEQRAESGHLAGPGGVDQRDVPRLGHAAIFLRERAAVTIPRTPISRSRFRGEK